MKALVLGHSGAIGAAVAHALSARASITGLSRADGLDWQDPARAEAVLRALDGPFEIIFDATGALHIGDHRPEKRLLAIDAEAMIAQFSVNALGPSLVLKHHDQLMPRTGRSIFATLSARVGSIEDNRLGGWIGYRAAKAALNQIVRTAAIEVARKRPEALVVALHPGTVKTPLTTPVIGDRPADAPAVAANRMLAVLDGLGAENSGGFYAYDGSQIPW